MPGGQESKKQPQFAACCSPRDEAVSFQASQGLKHRDMSWLRQTPEVGEERTLPGPLDACRQ